MSVLNIKNVDEDLLAQVKSKAALEKKPLRAVVINLLESYVVTKKSKEEDL